jgi:hypothetical protein
MIEPMLRTIQRSVTIGAVLLTLPLGTRAAAQKAPVNAHAATIAEFVKRVDAYAALHRKLESTIPELPKQGTPAQIDAHQRAMAKLIQDARKNAKPGDLFTREMQALVRSLLRPVFLGVDGLQMKAEILDKEFMGNVKLAVNGRYPDEVPLSTVPPQVLTSLPKLPEELEYRFVRQNLILLDPHAHIIADYVERAFK